LVQTGFTAGRFLQHDWQMPSLATGHIFRSIMGALNSGHD